MAVYIAVGVVDVAAAAAIFGVFCCVCAARNVARALDIRVDIAFVAVIRRSENCIEHTRVFVGRAECRRQELRKPVYKLKSLTEEFADLKIQYYSQARLFAANKIGNFFGRESALLKLPNTTSDFLKVGKLERTAKIFSVKKVIYAIILANLSLISTAALLAASPAFGMQ